MFILGIRLYLQQFKSNCIRNERSYDVNYLIAMINFNIDINYRRSNCACVLKSIESEIVYANHNKQQQVELQNNIENEVRSINNFQIHR